jgi:hypothetical protein
MSIVYVVTEPTHVINGVPVSSVNLTPAAEFGSIEILLPNNQALFNNVQTVRTLTTILSCRWATPFSCVWLRRLLQVSTVEGLPT